MPASSSATAPVQRSRFGAGFALAIAGALLGAGTQILLAPSLAGVTLGSGAALALLAAAVAVGLGAGAIAGRGRPSPRRAILLGLALGVGGLVAEGGTVAALSLAGGARAASEWVALLLVGAGLQSAAAAVTGVVAWLLSDRAAGGDDPAAGVPLRLALGGAAAGLALSAWAVAAGHVLGLRVGARERATIEAARDLAALAQARVDALDDDARARLLAALTPAGGALEPVDASGRAGALVVESAGHCRLAGRPLPCAAVGLADGRRLVAALPPAPLQLRLLGVFLAIGLILVGGAGALGLLFGAAAARELERVARNIDAVRREARQLMLRLDRPVVPASLDEVGALTAALGRLRRRLEPLVEGYRQARERATAADRARDAFLALVSAELRRPLNQVIEAAQALLDGRGGALSDAQQEDIRPILSASRHLGDLIDEVLDVSAIATGQVHLRLDTCDVGALLADVAKAQRPLVQKKALELNLEVASPSPRARADERRVRQVVTNLVSNAVKFTQKGHIDVACATRGESVILTVRDTGPGIAADQLPKLFREFVQLGSSKQRAAGTGLGLAICKRLVEAHGGAVEVESTPDEGSTFRVILPIEGPPAAAEDLDDTPVHGLEEAAG